MKRLTTKSERKFQRVMHEFGQGKLKSHGEKVTNPQQAQAIAFSEARQIYPNYGMKHEGGAANEPAVKGIFSLDAIEDKKFNGYTFGDDWNGWATPYFERPEANLIMEALGGTYKDGKYLFDDGYGGEEEYQKETIDTVDGPKEVFAIGAYNWTWDNDLMKNGGGITPARAAELAKIYSTGTAKELWGAWTTDNRLHFLMDHSTEYFELMGDDFYKSSKGFSALTYDTLPSPIRKSLLIHHAQGMYSNGGGISRFWDATKKQSKAAYEKSKELDSKGYDKTKQGYQKAKAYTEQKIHDKKKNIALDVLDKTRGNTDTKDQSRILNAASNLVEDQYAGGGGIEGWLEYKLGKLGRSSNYLVDIRSGMGLMALVLPRNEWCYPDGADVIWLDDWFERLFSAIRVDYNIKPFTWGTKERVDEYTDYKDTTNAKVDAGVEVKSDGTVIVEGDIEEFEKGYGFRIETMQDAKGENRNIYRLLTNPYSRGKGFAVGGKQSDVFIFALKYFTDNKSGYGISDGLTKDLPNIVKSMPEAKLEEAKKEAIEYLKNNNKESKPKKPMIQESDYQPELFAEGGGVEGMPPDPPTWEDLKKFFEGELPSKIPSEKYKTSIRTAETNLGAAPYTSLNIQPIAFKLKSMEEPLINIVSDDELRPALQSIHYDANRKEKVATNAHILVLIKDDSITKTKNIIPSTGKEVTEVQYPDYTRIIPMDNAYKIHLTESQVDALMDKLNGIVRAKRFLMMNEDHLLIGKIEYKDIEMYLNPVFLLMVLAALKQYGATAIDLEFSSPNRALMVLDSRKNGNKGLVMPVMYKQDFIAVDILDKVTMSAQPASKPVAVPVPSVAAPALKNTVERKPTPKADRKKPNTIHSCAVRLGRKGGKASAKARAQMGEGGEITASDVKPGARFKNPSGTIFIVDKISSYSDKTPKVESSLEGGDKGDYADPLDDFVAFLNEEEVQKLDEGGAAGEQPQESDEPKTCGCFHTFLTKEKPELVERMLTEDVNSNPELRAQVDEAHMAWQGGIM